METFRTPKLVALTLACALALMACTATSPVSAPSTSASPTSPTTPVLVPTEQTQSTPSESDVQVQAAPVPLSADGIGNLVWDVASVADVRALLGPPETIEPFECAPEMIELSYGGLGVYLRGGTLYSWQADTRSAVTTRVSFPDGVTPGSPLSRVLALTGAGELRPMESGFDLYAMQVRHGDVKNATWYAVADQAPSSQIELIAAPNFLLCS